ncbi:hypothetical protein AVEN_234371-1 [Araneus ventricosus]|uniref:Uncharacterized protein n=1 Tax=Araneus ventricosus TaxID=182803 RepID=A0A4Y2A9N1_ARAVE|nr:hypothetical protein AVEN_234371-1 [Araneus ventricosus]
MAGLSSLISPLRVPLMNTHPTAFSLGTATCRNPPHLYRSCMAGYGRLRSQSVQVFFKNTYWRVKFISWEVTEKELYYHGRLRKLRPFHLQMETITPLGLGRAGIAACTHRQVKNVKDYTLDPESRSILKKFLAQDLAQEMENLSLNDVNESRLTFDV